MYRESLSRAEHNLARCHGHRG